MINRNTLLGGAAALLLGAASAAGADTGAELEWKFRVYLDKKEIGYHDYRVSQDGTERQVATEAEFDVKFLFINAYSYRHENAETWREGCLTEIDAKTDANGDDFLVQGEKRGEQFALTTGEEQSTLAGCVMSFAYWNPEMLKQDRLLNAQTGEYQDVDIREGDLRTFEVNGERITAQQYDLILDKGTISVWYSTDNQRWVALDAPAKGDRRIRYEPISVPNSPVRLSSATAAAANIEG